MSTGSNKPNVQQQRLVALQKHMEFVYDGKRAYDVFRDPSQAPIDVESRRWRGIAAGILGIGPRSPQMTSFTQFVLGFAARSEWVGNETTAPTARPRQMNSRRVDRAITLSPKKPFTVNFIQGVVKIPKEFERVKEVKFDPGKVTFISATGKQVSVDVDHEFLNEGRK